MTKPTLSKRVMEILKAYRRWKPNMQYRDSMTTYDAHKSLMDAFREVVPNKASEQSCSRPPCFCYEVWNACIDEINRRMGDA